MKKGKQAAVLVFANGLNFFVNFISGPFLARKLSLPDNGLYGQVNLVNGLLLIIGILGIGSIINITLVENNKKENIVYSNNIAVYLFTAVLAFLGIYFGGDFLNQAFNNPNLSRYLLLSFPSLLFLLLSATTSNYYIHFDKTAVLAKVSFFSNFIKVLGLILIIHFYNSLEYLLIYINIISFLQFVIHLILLRKNIFPLVKPTKEKIKSILQLSLPYLLLSVLGYSIIYANGIIVSNQLGVKIFAIYRNGAIEIPFLATIYASVTSVLLPEFIKLINENKIEQLIALKQKISTTIATLIYPVLFFLLFNGQAFILLYLGDKYVDSGPIFIAFNLAVIIRINSYADILTIRKKPFAIILSNILVFAINLVLVYFLIKIFGAVGVAVSYSVTIILLSLILIYASTREINIPFSKYFNFKKLFKVIAVCVPFAFLSSLFELDSIFKFALIGGCYFVLVYYIVIIRFRLIELDFVNNKIDKFLKKIKIA